MILRLGMLGMVAELVLFALCLTFDLGVLYLYMQLTSCDNHTSCIFCLISSMWMDYLQACFASFGLYLLIAMSVEFLAWRCLNTDEDSCTFESLMD